MSPLQIYKVCHAKVKLTGCNFDCLRVGIHVAIVLLIQGRDTFRTLYVLTRPEARKTSYRNVTGNTGIEDVERCTLRVNDMRTLCRSMLV